VDRDSLCSDAFHPFFGRKVVDDFNDGVKDLAQSLRLFSDSIKVRWRVSEASGFVGSRLFNATEPGSCVAFQPSQILAPCFHQDTDRTLNRAINLAIVALCVGGVLLGVRMWQDSRRSSKE
jgi:hypothetical protein